MRLWRTTLLAGLASLLLASTLSAQTLTVRVPRGNVRSGPGAPHEIGTGLDTMVLVPAGWFLRGSTRRQAEEAKKYTWVKKEWFDFEVPQRSVYLDAFHIDKYPVTNAQFRKFGSPRNDYGPKFSGDRQPVGGVSWYQARDYCGSVGKRLPTEAEWEALETDEAKRDYARRLLDAMITYGETETAN